MSSFSMPSAAAGGSVVSLLNNEPSSQPQGRTTVATTMPARLTTTSTPPPPLSSSSSSSSSSPPSTLLHPQSAAQHQQPTSMSSSGTSTSAVPVSSGSSSSSSSATSTPFTSWSSGGRNLGANSSKFISGSDKVVFDHSRFAASPMPMALGYNGGLDKMDDDGGDLDSLSVDEEMPSDGAREEEQEEEKDMSALRQQLPISGNSFVDGARISSNNERSGGGGGGGSSSSSGGGSSNGVTGSTTTAAARTRSSIVQGGKKRYPCNHPGCDKTFSTSGHAARHNRIHTGQKPYRCTFPGCKASFSRQDNALAHFRTGHALCKAKASGADGQDELDTTSRGSHYVAQVEAAAEMGRRALEEGTAIAVVRDGKVERTVGHPTTRKSDSDRAGSVSSRRPSQAGDASANVSLDVDGGVSDDDSGMSAGSRAFKIGMTPASQYAQNHRSNISANNGNSNSGDPSYSNSYAGHAPSRSYENSHGTFEAQRPSSIHSDFNSRAPPLAGRRAYHPYAMPPIGRSRAATSGTDQLQHDGDRLSGSETGHENEQPFHHHHHLHHHHHYYHQHNGSGSGSYSGPDFARPRSIAGSVSGSSNSSSAGHFYPNHSPSYGNGGGPRYYGGSLPPLASAPNGGANGAPVLAPIAPRYGAPGPTSSMSSSSSASASLSDWQPLRLEGLSSNVRARKPSLPTPGEHGGPYSQPHGLGHGYGWSSSGRGSPSSPAGTSHFARALGGSLKLGSLSPSVGTPTADRERTLPGLSAPGGSSAAGKPGLPYSSDRSTAASAPSPTTNANTPSAAAAAAGSRAGGAAPPYKRPSSLVSSSHNVHRSGSACGAGSPPVALSATGAAAADDDDDEKPVVLAPLKMPGSAA
ncbi:unnamed protein product [Jaminaea pallidilutea]